MPSPHGNWACTYNAREYPKVTLGESGVTCGRQASESGKIPLRILTLATTFRSLKEAFGILIEPFPSGIQNTAMLMPAGPDREPHLPSYNRASELLTLGTCEIFGENPIATNGCSEVVPVSVDQPITRSGADFEPPFNNSTHG